MSQPVNLTRRAALAKALGLSLAPIALASSAAARGGPDPWKPKRKRKSPGTKPVSPPLQR